jgi:hypothetical protein
MGPLLHFLEIKSVNQIGYKSKNELNRSKSIDANPIENVPMDANLLSSPHRSYLAKLRRLFLQITAC